MGILYIFLCNYSEVKYGHLYFVVLGEIVLFFPPVRFLLIRIEVMNRQYSDLLFHYYVSFNTFEYHFVEFGKIFFHREFIQLLVLIVPFSGCFWFLYIYEML